MIKLYAKLAAAVAAGILGAKILEFGGRKTVKIGKEALNRRKRKGSEEDKED